MNVQKLKHCVELAAKDLVENPLRKTRWDRIKADMEPREEKLYNQMDAKLEEIRKWTQYNSRSYCEADVIELHWKIDEVMKYIRAADNQYTKLSGTHRLLAYADDHKEVHDHLTLGQLADEVVHTAEEAEEKTSKTI